MNECFHLETKGKGVEAQNAENLQCSKQSCVPTRATSADPLDHKNCPNVSLLVVLQLFSPRPKRIVFSFSATLLWTVYLNPSQEKGQKQLFAREIRVKEFWANLSP